ncbi:MAG TPA: M1 family metallopeptidase, partial [Candidatus Acidoferrales bacterium]|nr:M1 family metallopeptidase [Candidatus Acidoferrales bacterium]
PRTRRAAGNRPKQSGVARRAGILAVALLAFVPVGHPDEPYARSRDYDLQDARIALRFDLEQRKVMGEVTHTLAALRDGLTRFAFDSVGLSIASVTVGGKPAKFETTATQLLAALDHPSRAGEKFEIYIRYEGQPKRGLYFVLPDKSYPDRPKEIWTQGEAEDTRYYIPIYDYPNDRTTTEMTVTVPRGWLTVSNGKLLGVADSAGDMKTWHWRQAQPHSTYLISLVAGEFEVTQETWRSIPVTYYVPRGRSERIAPTFARTRPMLEFYSNLLGVPYPWSQYAQVAVDEFVVGGMENTSATTLTTNALLHPLLAAESLEGSDSVIAHEMAHQWFGDLVTCKDWADLWLNEGFATYFQTLWEEHHYGADEYAYTFWQRRNAWLDAQRLYAVPIVTHNFTDAIQYAGNFYGKASWVLHMLRHQLGDAAFYRAMKHYLEANRGQNVASADLARAIEEATATNVDRFFDEWVYGAGAPRFEVHSSYEEATRQVKLEVKQTQKVEDRVGVFRVPVEIEITTASGRKSYPIIVSKATETFLFAVDGPPLMVLFDKGNHILKSLDFPKSPKEWACQLKNAEAVPDRADAARALSEVRNDDRVVAALGEAVLRDPFWGVRAEALRALGNLGGPAAREQVLAGLANEKPWVRQPAVEMLGHFPADDAVAARLENIYREDKAYRVRAAALAGLAQQKSANAFVLLQAAAATDSPDDRLRAAALRALGALGDDRAAPGLLEWSATGKPTVLRMAAITSLGRIDRKNKAITQRLISYLPETYRGIRVATINALGERGDPEAGAPLEALLKSGELSESLQRATRNALDRLKQTGTAEKK